MHWVYGIDSSFDELTPLEAKRLKASGVEVFAACLWTGVVAPLVRIKSLQAAQAAGLATIGYISVSYGHSGTWHVDHARDGIPPDVWSKLVRVPIDVELEGLTMQEHIIPALVRVAELAKPRDIYTNYHTWVDILGNPAALPNTGLWNAIWDEHPDFDFPRFRYGGWQDSQVWGEQWSGGTNVMSQFVDRNQFRADALGIHAPAVPPATIVPVSPFSVVLLRYVGAKAVYLAHLWHINDTTRKALQVAGVVGPIAVRVVPAVPVVADAASLGPNVTGIMLRLADTPITFFVQLWRVPDATMRRRLQVTHRLPLVDIQVA